MFRIMFVVILSISCCINGQLTSKTTWDKFHADAVFVTDESTEESPITGKFFEEIFPTTLQPFNPFTDIDYEGVIVTNTEEPIPFDPMLQESAMIRALRSKRSTDERNWRSIESKKSKN